MFKGRLKNKIVFQTAFFHDSNLNYWFQPNRW